LSLPRLAGEKATVGGLAPKALKKENGAKLLTPSLLTVDTKAIGLGPMPPSKRPCLTLSSRSFGSTEYIKYFSF
jgi:hypothetical protein